jgi:hypothetical protein
MGIDKPVRYKVIDMGQAHILLPRYASRSNEFDRWQAAVVSSGMGKPSASVFDFQKRSSMPNIEQNTKQVVLRLGICILSMPSRTDTKSSMQFRERLVMPFFKSGEKSCAFEQLAKVTCSEYLQG